MGIKEDQTQHENVTPSDVWVIRIKKQHTAITLFGVICFLGGFFANSLIQNASTEAVARPESQIQEPVNSVDTSPTKVAVDPDDDPFLGPVDAPVTIVEFSDFQCPFCQRFRQQTLDQVLAAYEGKVRFVYRDYPLRSIHPNAQKAAEAAQCAHEQDQFWAMHDRLFAEMRTWSSASDVIQIFTGYAQELGLDDEQFNHCLATGKYVPEVLHDLEQGKAYGVTGTPAFFINGRPLSGAVPFAVFQKIIEAELATED